MNYSAALTEWYTSIQGQQVYEHEAMQLAQLLPNCFGYHLLQLGGPTNLQWLDSSPIKHRMVVSPVYDSINPASCLAELEQLPFLPNSMDVILLPHTLETAAHPQMLLQAAIDTLAPGGNLIILGVNPMSLWGLQHYLQPVANFPWLQHFYSVHRLQTQLLQTNCMIDELQFDGYQPRPANYVTPLYYSRSFWDTFGAFMWPSWGNIYIMVARKQVYGMTPIKNKSVFKKLNTALDCQQLRSSNVKKN